MSQIPSTFGTSASQQPSGSKDAINNIDLDVFLKLMIKELQNQDPLNPLDNRDMLAQISQIREVGATDKLTQTLDSVLLGQNIASATNLIGAEITALSDDNQQVEGVVKRVTIAGGLPKLQVEDSTVAKPSGTEGKVDAGKHSYRIVWQGDDGTLFGIELSGDDAVKTTGQPGVDQSVLIKNLPATAGPKQIFRTDASGEGEYRLVGVLNEGSQSSFVDSLADEERFDTRLGQAFQKFPSITRKYEVSLKNVAAIRPPQSATDTPAGDTSSEDDSDRPDYTSPTRPDFNP